MADHDTHDHTGIPGVSSGSVATDTIWNAAGDLAVGTGSDTAARLGIGATDGMAVVRASAAVAWAFPPGYELGYAQRTTDVTVTATSEGAAHTVVATSSATTEAVPYIIEVYSPRVQCGAAGVIVMDVYVDSTILGRIGIVEVPAGSTPFLGRLRYTPSAASHTFTWKVWRGVNDGTLGAGSAGTGASVAAYIRVTKG